MTIEVETGPMFSGKSEALGDLIKSHKLCNHQLGQEYLAFNHSSDNRYGTGIIHSHDGQEHECFSISTSSDLLTWLFDVSSNGNLLLKPEFIRLRAIYIDEGQFFDKDLPNVLTFIDDIFRQVKDRSEPILIDIAGLDLDFRGEPFNPMPDIIAKADDVRKHKATCKICGKKNATRTQRIVNGQPANYYDPIILVGATESYTARCPDHHEVPGKPQPKIK